MNGEATTVALEAATLASMLPPSALRDAWLRRLREMQPESWRHRCTRCWRDMDRGYDSVLCQLCAECVPRGPYLDPLSGALVEDELVEGG